MHILLLQSKIIILEQKLAMKAKYWYKSTQIWSLIANIIITALFEKKTLTCEIHFFFQISMFLLVFFPHFRIKE